MCRTDIENRIYTMKAYKNDGRIHYEQELRLIEEYNGHVVLSGDIGRQLKHYTRQAVYTFDKETLEYFFADRWYTAALVFGEDGEIVHVYCNIAFPCNISEGLVEFTDLDVDVIVRDGQIEVVDVDEFEAHRGIYNYDDELERKVFAAVDRVKKDIVQRNYPFDRDILRSS